MKTAQGRKLFSQSQYLKELEKDVFSPETKIITKRASLWALGSIGRSEEGISLILNTAIIQNLISMAESLDYLSLRGTCIYVLNMFANTQLGRNELLRFNWLSTSKNDKEWICLPHDIKQFFVITVPDSAYKMQWPLQEKYWSQFRATSKRFIHSP